MASRKRTKKHPALDADESESTPDPAPEYEVGAPDGKLTPDQRGRLTSLLPKASDVIQSIEDRMTALSVAATARWKPAQLVHETDENSAPVMGDDEYADFLKLVEDLAEHAIFREVALFMGLPEAVVDQVLTQALTTDFVVPSNTANNLKRAAQPFVKRSVNPAPPLDLSR
jgi:hypothetical protein